jgi:hypothetical protein
MPSAAELLYTSLSSVASVDRLISDGEGEGQYLEAKSPGEPRFSKGMKHQTACTASAFANTEGGVILFGVGTVKHIHDAFDVLTNFEPIANVDSFVRGVSAALPQLHTPTISRFEVKSLRRRSQTSGVAVLLVPRTSSGPVRCNHDHEFYMRSGGDDVVAPYETIQRLFAATDVPELMPVFPKHAIKVDDSGTWKLSIGVENSSSAVARDVRVILRIEPVDACEVVGQEGFVDVSDLNQMSKVFASTVPRPVHRALVDLVGNVSLRMAKSARTRRALRIYVALYADRMVARGWVFTVHLTKTSFDVKKVDGPDYLY